MESLVWMRMYLRSDHYPLSAQGGAQVGHTVGGDVEHVCRCTLLWSVDVDDLDALRRWPPEPKHYALPMAGTRLAQVIEGCCDLGDCAEYQARRISHCPFSMHAITA
jgi:hypothetical protein